MSDDPLLSSLQASAPRSAAQILHALNHPQGAGDGRQQVLADEFGDDDDEANDNQGVRAMPYAIWCRVSGGVTGTREAWLKSNDKLVLFDTLAAAEADAAHRKEAMNASPYRTAYFQYTAMEYDGLPRPAAARERG